MQSKCEVMLMWSASPGADSMQVEGKMRAVAVCVLESCLALPNNLTVLYQDSSRTSRWYVGRTCWREYPVLLLWHRGCSIWLFFCLNLFSFTYPSVFRQKGESQRAETPWFSSSDTYITLKSWLLPFIHQIHKCSSESSPTWFFQ